MTEVHPHVEQRAGIDVVRVGRKPNPLAFVPMEHQTWAGRFDDPAHLWRTLYTASDEHGAWVEVLGRFRIHPDTQAALDDIIEEPSDAAPLPAGTVSLAWLATRAIGHAKVMGRVADLASADTLRCWIPRKHRAMVVADHSRRVKAWDQNSLTVSFSSAHMRSRSWASRPNSSASSKNPSPGFTASLTTRAVSIGRPSRCSKVAM